MSKYRTKQREVVAHRLGIDPWPDAAWDAGEFQAEFEAVE